MGTIENEGRYPPNVVDFIAGGHISGEPRNGPSAHLSLLQTETDSQGRALEVLPGPDTTDPSWGSKRH